MPSRPEITGADRRSQITGRAPPYAGLERTQRLQGATGRPLERHDVIVSPTIAVYRSPDIWMDRNRLYKVVIDHHEVGELWPGQACRSTCRRVNNASSWRLTSWAQTNWFLLPKLLMLWAWPAPAEGRWWRSSIRSSAERLTWICMSRHLRSRPHGRQRNRGPLRPATSGRRVAH